LFFCEIEIENVLGSAVGTRMPLRITIKENYIKFLCALVAIGRLFYWKIPFHSVVPGTLFWPRRPLCGVSSLQWQMDTKKVLGQTRNRGLSVSGKGGLTEDGRSTIGCAELQLAASIWQESHRPPHHYFRRKRPSRRPVTPPPSPRCTYDRVCRELPRLFSEIVERMQLLGEQRDILVVQAADQSALHVLTLSNTGQLATNLRPSLQEVMDLGRQQLTSQ
jgi:hypothetical protein